MTSRPSKPLFPNPFYVLLMAASVFFVMTALAYLVSPLVQGAERDRSGGESIAALFDRRAPLALGIEFVVMLLAGACAMATDRWFTPDQPGKKPWGP